MCANKCYLSYSLYKETIITINSFFLPVLRTIVLGYVYEDVFNAILTMYGLKIIIGKLLRIYLALMALFTYGDWPFIWFEGNLTR